MVGTYAAVTYSSDSVKQLIQFGKKYKIPNLLNADKIHTTLLYSRKHCPDLEAGVHNIAEIYLTAEPYEFDVWASRPDDGSKPKRCLVLKLDSPHLVAFHKGLMETHKAIYDFEEYTPHITLSYDIADFHIAEIESRIKDLEKFTVVEFYSEELDLNCSVTQGDE